MSRHDGVSCDACLKNNFKGRRYKCLICFDYDLCSSCYENGAVLNQHSSGHPMQCILTRHDFDIFHGGEALTADQPQSLTCPFCGKMGFTERTLQEHVTANHLDTSTEVVCPICASVPRGDPNHVTDDFAAHLTLDHPSGAPRELDVSDSINRHGVRRMPHQGRGLSRGVARQNMRFGSVNSGLFSSSSRSDSMDPIAELLSQLSGVRRATASDLLLSTADSHLNQANSRSQQAEQRLPSRRSGLSSTNPATVSTSSHSQTQSSSNGIGVGANSVALSSSVNGAPGTSNSSGNVVVNLGARGGQNAVSTTHQSSSSSTSQSNSKQSQSQFLLARIAESESSESDPSKARARAAFVQDLLISTLCDLSLRSSQEPEEPQDEAPAPTTAEVGTQTLQNVATTPTTLNSTSPLGFSGFPLTKNSSSSSVTLSGMKVSKSQAKLVNLRSSPTMTQVTSALQFSQSNAVPGGRVVTGSGTVSIPAGAASQANCGRRKPLRGDDGRPSQPPPPH